MVMLGGGGGNAGVHGRRGFPRGFPQRFVPSRFGMRLRIEDCLEGSLGIGDEDAGEKKDGKRRKLGDDDDFLDMYHRMLGQGS